MSINLRTAFAISAYNNAVLELQAALKENYEQHKATVLLERGFKKLTQDKGGVKSS